MSDQSDQSDSAFSIPTISTSTDHEDNDFMVAKKLKKPLRALPSLEDYSRIEKAYYEGLTATRVSKALISEELYEEIKAVLLSPSSTKYGTAQFRYWVRKMFRYRVVDEEVIVIHENRPVATKDRIYSILCRCHTEAGHGGRDRTNAEIRKHYTWIPKEIVAQFVASCPTCYEDRFAPASTRKQSKAARRANKLPKYDWMKNVASMEASPPRKLTVIRTEQRRAPLADLPINTQSYQVSEPTIEGTRIIEVGPNWSSGSQLESRSLQAFSPVVERQFQQEEGGRNIPEITSFMHQHNPGDTLLLRTGDGLMRQVRYSGCNGRPSYLPSPDPTQLTLPPLNPVPHTPTPLQDVSLALGLGIKAMEDTSGTPKLHVPIYHPVLPSSPFGLHPGLKMNDPLGFTRPHCPSPGSGTPRLRNVEHCVQSAKSQSEGSTASPRFSESPSSTPRPTISSLSVPPKRKRVGLSDLLNDDNVNRIARTTPSPKRQRFNCDVPRESSDHGLTNGSSAKSSRSSRSSFEEMHLQWDWEPSFPAPNLREYGYDSIHAPQPSLGALVEKPFSLFNLSDPYDREFDYQLSASQCDYGIV